MAAQLFGVGVDGDRLTDGVGHEFVHARAAPLTEQVDLGAVGGQPDVDPGRLRGVQNQRTRQFGHGVVIAVGLVCLEHRELGRVRRVDAFVSEGAADLVHLFDAAHDAPLQVQLGRNSKRHVEVECVQMRVERTRRRPAVHSLQNRRFHLEVSEPVQRFPQRAHHLGAGAHHLARLGPDDQVDIALADAHLLRQRLVCDGQRSQRLCRDLPRLHEHRQLAALGRDHLAGDEDQVAEVDIGLPRGERLLAHAVEREHRLQLDAVLAQRGEAQLAGVAHEDHAAGDADLVAGLLARGQVRVGGADLGERMRAGHPHRERAPVAVVGGHEPVVLLPPDPQLLGQVVDAVSAVGAGGCAAGGMVAGGTVVTHTQSLSAAPELTYVTGKSSGRITAVGAPSTQESWHDHRSTQPADHRHPPVRTHEVVQVPERSRARRARRGHLDQPGRDRCPARPERRRQVHDDRHAARPAPPGLGGRQRVRHDARRRRSRPAPSARCCRPVG